MLKNLYECFVQRDCSEIQINPLIYTPDRKFIATNTIIRLDPDSLYRQQDLAANYIDLSQISVNERIANAHAIQYTDLEGNIGMLCNSAGLCMASNDVIVSYGGQPANFADLGGTHIHESIDQLLYILNTAPAVKVIFINCFGGLTNIRKVVATLKMGIEMGIVTKPVVARVLGAQTEDSEQILRELQKTHPIHIENDFDEACKTAVKIAHEEE